MVDVEFTETEWDQIHRIAHDRATRNGFKPGWDLADLQARNIVGVAGEAAVSRYTNLPWHGRSNSLEVVFSHNDVGNLEVRTRNKPNQLDLGIKPYEFEKYPITQKFVLCWLKEKIVTLVGWTTLGRIERHGRHNDQFEITFYDWQKLYDMETILL
jgi:hypothetical protein